MMEATWLVLPIVAALALAVGYLIHKTSSDRRIGGAEREAKRIVETAEKDAATRLSASERDAETRRRSLELEARESTLKARTAFDDETRKREREIQSIEQRILTKEEELARKLDQMERRLGEYADKDKGLVTRERAVSDNERKLASAMEEQRRKLESIAGLTADEAKRQLLGQMEEEARREAQLIGMRLEEEARETAREKAKEVLATTIQRAKKAESTSVRLKIKDTWYAGETGQDHGHAEMDALHRYIDAQGGVDAAVIHFKRARGRVVECTGKPVCVRCTQVLKELGFECSEDTVWGMNPMGSTEWGASMNVKAFLKEYGLDVGDIAK